MANKRTIETLTKGFDAAERIRQATRSNLREDESLAVKPSNLYIANEIFEILKDYAPEPQKEVLTNALFKTREYSNSYRSLKQHLHGTRGRNIAAVDVVKALEMMKPMLKNNQNILIDKMSKIFNILQS